MDDFAGHPLLGAAAVLHRRSRPEASDATWIVAVGGRSLAVRTALRADGVVWAEMDQGRPQVMPELSPEVTRDFAPSLGLEVDQLRSDLPGQVVSTGLPYLLLPVTAGGLAASRVAVSDLPQLLAAVGAEFVYVLDPDRPEGRTWDNAGVTEDVATGSAAGPTAAYLVDHGLRPAGTSFEVHQGRFVGRPSRMTVRQAENGSLLVGGLVAPFSSGTIDPRVLSG